MTSIREGLDVFFVPGAELEVRILKTPKGTISGYFSTLDAAVCAVEKADADLKGSSTFYATLNPVTHEVHARAANRLKPFAEYTTKDAEILRRSYLLLDFDPVRPAGVSSTETELALALARRDEIVAWLTGTQDWPAPLRAMSGNGGHALYRIDLPNDNAARDLVRGCLDVLSRQFATPAVAIDRTVFNAARICKLYGTIARKGDPTPDRPHRRAEIEERPALHVVTLEQLQALAAQRPRMAADACSQPSRAQAFASPRLDMREEFDRRGWYRQPLTNGKHAVQCPWSHEHSGNSGVSETVIFEPGEAEGLWGFKCQHEHCAHRTIRDVWERVRPPAGRRRSTVPPATSTERAPTPTGGPTDEPAPVDDTTAVRAGDADGPIPLGARDPETGRLVLSPRRTLPTADAYVRAFHHHPEGRLLHGYAGSLFEWRDNRYGELEVAAISCRLQTWLHTALRYIVVDRRAGTLRLTDFESNPSTVNQALDSIRAFVHLPATIGAPSWLDDRVHPPALEILACRSMNVHIPSGEVLPATPRLFTTHALDFDYDRQARPPVEWLAFLEQLWETDRDAIGLLQEWCGYCLIPNTCQQKMLLLVGPRRSGKGTIGRILRRLVGAANVVGPTTSSLAGAFGLQPLIGKSLAIVSDARFTGDHVATVVERLLCISGEDALTIDRKFLGAVTMKLSTRFVFLTNELPRLNDASTALAGRFLILRLTRSFYDQEDPTLTERLSQELPGILLWAIDGWTRLQQRGHFVQPTSAADAMQQLEDLASPIRPFVRECCTILPELRVPIDTLYAAWDMWCKQNGRKVGTKQTFGRDLGSAVPQVVRRRGTGFVSFYEGMSLTSETAAALDRFQRTRARESDGD
jgi:putative DNA primase/helicase